MLGIDFTQILLHLFNTVLLFAGLYFLLYKPVLNFMKKREDTYAAMDREAKEKLSAAESAQKEHEEKLSAVQKEIETLRAEASAEIARMKEESTEEAKAKADQILGKAREDAKRERTDILSSLKKDVTELVELTAQKVADGENPGDAFDRFLAEAEGSAADGNR